MASTTEHESHGTHQTKKATARRTYRVHLNDLGNRDVVPVDKPEYDRMREQTLAHA